MTLLKHGSIGKRVVAFLAVLVMLHAAALEYPARAAAALPVIGAAVTLSAFLMASGIYPFIIDDDTNLDFSGWSTDCLQTLWNQYQVQAEVAPPSFDKISALLSAGTILIGNALWQELIKFVNWIKSEFSISDNQEGVQIGELISHGWDTVITSQYILMPYQPAPITWQMVVEFGISGANDNFHWLLSCAEDNTPYKVYFARFGTESSFDTVAVSGAQGQIFYSCDTNGNWFQGRELNKVYSYSNVTCYYRTFGGVNILPTNGYTIPLYSTFDDFVSYLVGANLLTQRLDDENIDNRVNIDTTTVAPPAALPETAQFGGLAIPAAGLSPTAEQVSQVIQQGVVLREQPQVVPAEVEIGAGTEVDTETGVIVQNPVEITQESAIPGADALVSQPLITAIANTMQTKFPFCLPFDIMRLFSAFNSTPQAPQIVLTFTDPFSEHDYTISVDLSPWDNVAGTVRQFETMILFVGFWLNFDKFNILNTILGQLG